MTDRNLLWPTVVASRQIALEYNAACIEERIWEERIWEERIWEERIWEERIWKFTGGVRSGGSMRSSVSRHDLPEDCAVE